MNYRTRIAGTLTAAVMSAAAAVALAPPASAAEGLYNFQNFGSGKCIQPNPANLMGQGSRIVQLPCNGSPFQKWTIDPIGGGYYHFVNAGSGLCMDLGGTAQLRSPVIQWGCNLNTDERFIPPNPIPNLTPKEIHSKISGGTWCLDAAGVSEDLTPIQIYKCVDDHPWMLWFVRRA